MAEVTRLRYERPGLVAVEVDGRPWRVLPEEVVVRAALAAGTALDRGRLRLIRRELRRLEALGVATRALTRRDLSSSRLERRLEQAGIAPAGRSGALDTLTRAGLVDDERVALARARALARRGLGDAAITHDLVERQGLDIELTRTVLKLLEPETLRAEAIAAARGRSLATARHLARRGFGEGAIEAAVGVEIAPGG